MRNIKLDTPAKKVAYLGIMSAIALILGYIEFLIPFNFGIPGIKLGLANLIVLLVLMTSDIKTSITVSALKISLTSLLFGNFFSFFYSLAGGLLSLVTMALLKRCKAFSVIGISIAGGTAHNIGQLLMALVLTSVPVIAYYLPILMIFGALMGMILGFFLQLILKKYKY